jgi:ferredoxin
MEVGRSAPVRRLAGERGAALIELALVLPVLLMLVLGIYSAGLGYSRKVAVTNAAREASRFGATLPISVATGGTLLGWLDDVADAAEQAALCIGCGACVAACPNGAAQLFTGAKVTHLNLLPQGQPERYSRVEAMVDTMEQYFGSCTNHGECEIACPKSISLDVIAVMNADYLKAKFKNRRSLSRV